ncbi:MAG TPA: hypothetical protein VKB95_07660 [Chitinophagaceae bacterium]|nr:hypothetical protein [Chitinophagaceae bacterium]
MKIIFFVAILFVSSSAFSQHEGDSVYRRCPVAIKDTATGNNYFIEHQPATVKTYRNKGNYTIVIEQKSQYFTMFFRVRGFSTKKRSTYSIATDANSNGELSAKYSFRSGESVAFIDVSSGKAEVTYDKATKLWHVKLTGLIANMGDTRVTYFKATADFYIR